MIRVCRRGENPTSAALCVRTQFLSRTFTRSSQKATLTLNVNRRWDHVARRIGVGDPSVMTAESEIYFWANLPPNKAALREAVGAAAPSVNEHVVALCAGQIGADDARRDGCRANRCTAGAPVCGYSFPLPCCPRAGAGGEPTLLSRMIGLSSRSVVRFRPRSVNRQPNLVKCTYPASRTGRSFTG